VDAAVKYKRKVAVSGRSMENVVNKSLEIGYLDIPKGVLVDIDAVDQFARETMVIITTGSQGEPMSALSRMSTGDHRKLTVTPGDCIIISATPIPGNEKTVTRVVNELMRLGAEVVYEKMYDIHVSGHACQDELKMLMALTKPKFFMPMHGEFKHLKKHAALAISMGIDPKNVMVSEIGKVVELDSDSMKQNGSVQSGKVLVDGLGVGDVGSIVLRDRKHLAQDGLIVVVTTIDLHTGEILSGPDIVSRGFVYVRESENMLQKARGIARDSIIRCMEGNTREWGVIKQRVRDDVGDYLWQVTKRNPMILPVIQEI
jgi:ribonuclease J